MYSGDQSLWFDFKHTQNGEVCHLQIYIYKMIRRLVLLDFHLTLTGALKTYYFW